jgi:CRISPR/Cas system-associated exonuclease Cas4 (RecB family)
LSFSKTDFIQYLNCPKSLWLLKRDPDAYPYGEFSAFMKKLTREGYDVERWGRRYFENEGDRSVSFQRVFETDDGLFARADAVEETSDGKTVLYEIKSSTSVKSDKKHNHVKDACFQKVCAERAGQSIDRVYLVHLNGAYVRAGEIAPEELLVFADVTEHVEDIAATTVAEIDAALEFLANEIDRNGCSCIEQSRGNHCDTFALFNPDVPTPSIYSLPRLSAKKRQDFLSMGIFGLDAVADDYPLSEAQRRVVQAAKSGKPQINTVAIKTFLSKLAFPLSFFDYETFASAVPLIDGASPHKHFPVQYSLHIMEKDGSLTHREYLEREARMPLRLIEQMQADIGPVGSIVSWHASFEKTRNREMADAFPDKAEFLNDLNDRMVDLEDVFKTDYVDARFDGSTSIKKVLPVICPHLGYGDLDVQDGSSAMEAWERMINAEPEEAERIARSLLSYCERDTLAMVEIYRFLSEV